MPQQTHPQTFLGAMAPPIFGRITRSFTQSSRQNSSLMLIILLFLIYVVERLLEQEQEAD